MYAYCVYLMYAYFVCILCMLIVCILCMHILYAYCVVDIRQKLRVTMINALELEEAGYGEGVFREFLSELIKEAFDPNRGLFYQTEQQELYPNPQVMM